MSLTKVTRNYQITVPRDIREMAKITEGDKIVMTIENGEIKIKKIDEDVFERAFGSWKNVKDSLEYVKSVRSGWKTRKRRFGV